MQFSLKFWNAFQYAPEDLILFWVGDVMSIWLTNKNLNRFSVHWYNKTVLVELSVPITHVNQLVISFPLEICLWFCAAQLFCFVLFWLLYHFFIVKLDSVYIICIFEILENQNSH